MSSALKYTNDSTKRNPSLYIVAFLSGLALSFSFPGRDFAFIAWFALTPFIIALTDCPRPSAFKAGIVFGLPFFFGTQYWIYYSINHYGHLNIVLSILVVLLLCLYESLYIGIFGLILNYVTKKSAIPLVLTAPALWVCLEFARGYIITGFPWSFLGYSQYTFLSLIQIADITGIYGISFLIVAVNAVIADFVIIRRRRRIIPLYPTVPVYLGSLALVIFIIITLIYGYVRVSETVEGKDLRIAIVQGNIDQDIKWKRPFQLSVFSKYLSLTTRISESNPDLVVWPETSVPFIFGNDKELTAQLTDFQKENRIPLLFGSIIAKSAEGKKYILANSAILLGSDGNVQYTYDKIHLVPFGEYVPLRSVLFFIDRLVEGIGTYVPGNSYTSAQVSLGTFATVICYELIFPSLVRNFFLKGGDFLVTITNDAWFGNTIGPIQHFYTGVFRAVENRKPVIRAANTGISGFIDSKGSVLAKSALFKQEVLLVDITTDKRITFYTKYGDIFVYICLLTVTIILINQLFHSTTRFGGKRW